MTYENPFLPKQSKQKVSDPFTPQKPMTMDDFVNQINAPALKKSAFYQNKLLAAKGNADKIADLMVEMLRDLTIVTPASPSVLKNIKALDGVVDDAWNYKVNPALNIAAWIPSLSLTAGTLKLGGKAGVKTGIDGGVRKLLGDDNAADITQGTTRDRSRMEDGKVVRDELSSESYIVLRKFILSIPRVKLDDVFDAFEKKSGKSFYVELGELLDPMTRDQLFKSVAQSGVKLPEPISKVTLTLDAFLEQLASGLSYSNESAEAINTQVKAARGASNPAQLLKHFGYKAGSPIFGRWGFQMRVFYPVKGKAFWGMHPIVVFRGTEGVKVDIDGSSGAAAERRKADAKGLPLPQVLKAEAQGRNLGVEGTVDTVIGDLNFAQVGWLQYSPNKELIERQLGKASGEGKLYAAGHSLGGAIAQLVVAKHTEFFKQLVTFQSPSVDVSTVNEFKRHEEETGDVKTRHYRLDGDIVPTAGERALPGDIYYFNRMSKEKGGDFTSAAIDNLSAGHNIPMLSTYIRGMPKGDANLDFISKYGMHDAESLGNEDGKSAKDVAVVFAGDYTTEKDPRIILEKQRDQLAEAVNAVPLDLSLQNDLYEIIFYKHIPFNTELAYIEDLVKTSADYAEFTKSVGELLEKDRLPMQQQELELAAKLRVDERELQPRASREGLSFFGPSKLAQMKKLGVEIDDKTRAYFTNTILHQIWLSWRGEK